ncbi:hypothetical protein BC826DRAFT_330957 [Russula brevipes]|nr:hypothetical protein BC826DRAFT_330957 [Russula brevipes]
MGVAERKGRLIRHICDLVTWAVVSTLSAPSSIAMRSCPPCPPAFHHLGLERRGKRHRHLAGLRL